MNDVPKDDDKLRKKARKSSKKKDKRDTKRSSSKSKKSKRGENNEFIGSNVTPATNENDFQSKNNIDVAIPVENFTKQLSSTALDYFEPTMSSRKSAKKKKIRPSSKNMKLKKSSHISEKDIVVDISKPSSDVISTPNSANHDGGGAEVSSGQVHIYIDVGGKDDAVVRDKKMKLKSSKCALLGEEIGVRKEKITRKKSNDVEKNPIAEKKPADVEKNPSMEYTKDAEKKFADVKKNPIMEYTKDTEKKLADVATSTKSVVVDESIVNDEKESTKLSHYTIPVELEQLGSAERTVQFDHLPRIVNECNKSPERMYSDSDNDVSSDYKSDTDDSFESLDTFEESISYQSSIDESMTSNDSDSGTDGTSKRNRNDQDNSCGSMESDSN